MIEAKMRIDSLQFEKTNVEQKGQTKSMQKNYQLKEADQIIEELTNTLQKRENEMKIALAENEKLMERCRKLDAAYLASQNMNKQIKGEFSEQLVEAENRIKLTQD